MRPHFVEVAPASRRISARHRLHNVVTTSIPSYTSFSFCTSLSMCIPVEEPAQEPAPAIDKAACFDLVPAEPMHTIAEASPGSASETVVGAEHAAAVPPYPYDLQPVQDAPAEPVAESSVPEERAEVPQPRQWADEGGWDSRAVFMPITEVVPAAATVAEDNQNPFADPPPAERLAAQRGRVCILDVRIAPLSRYYVAASRDSSGALCAVSRPVLRYYARFLVADYFGMQRIGAPRKAQNPMRAASEAGQSMGHLPVRRIDPTPSARMAERARTRGPAGTFI
ncbi:hypothetical protein FB451DRAFT_1184484 [Mycena latifolia]|nr:hypothetical protein FB451DRAFT_1184484 [Mycena latifolia]